MEHISEAIGYFKEEATHRNIELNFAAPTNQLIVWMDSDMLEKIMFNLLSNAFKVTSENGVVTVAINRCKKPGPFPLIGTGINLESFKISIRDTGPGLAQKEYKKIFKRFYQIGELNKSYYGSTGIGLEMVKSFIEMHKGKIEVKSQIGEGTEFIVTLPLGKDHFSPTEILYGENISESTGEVAVSEPSLDDGTHQEQTLLIVEDNQELRDYLKGALKKQYRIILSENGKKGLDLALEKGPNIILTDVIMPVMDGLEFYKRIKSDIRTSHIPLLMLTAKATFDCRSKQAFWSGVSEF